MESYFELLMMIAERTNQNYAEFTEEELQAVKSDTKAKDIVLVKEILKLFSDVLPETKYQMSFGQLKQFLNIVGSNLNEIAEANLIKLINHFV